MTLVEISIVIAIVGVMLTITFSSLQDWNQNERASAAARSVAGLLRSAASEAIRTGSVHVVFLSIAGSGDVLGSALADANGDWVPMLVLNDGQPGSAGQNCAIDAGEPTQTIPAVGGILWGSSLAGGTKAFGDSTAIVSTSGSSFATPAGAATTWVAFMPDGRPLGFDSSCTFGQLGTGNGGIYLTNGKRDHAVVLSALGAVKVHSWESQSGSWTQ